LTDPTKKRHKLIFEILRMVALCFALSLLLFAAGVTLSRALIEEYCFQHDVYMDEFDWYHLEHTLTAVGFAGTVGATGFTGLRTSVGFVGSSTAIGIPLSSGSAFSWSVR